MVCIEKYIYAYGYYKKMCIAFAAIQNLTGKAYFFELSKNC
jgi:hypothetical protein